MNKLCCVVNPEYRCTSCDWLLCVDCRMPPDSGHWETPKYWHDIDKPSCKGMWRYINNDKVVRPQPLKFNDPK